MHTGSYYKLSEFLKWTRLDIYRIFVIATVPTVLFQLFDCAWLAVPWLPVALVGTAAAFLVGFRNTQTYNRLWEARQIWGAIVNSSRSWGIWVRDGVAVPPSVHRELIYRHCAWLTALRYQLREPREWETMNLPRNIEYRKFFKVPEYETTFDDAIQPFLSPEELSFIKARKNKAAQLLALQSAHLRRLRESGLLEPLHFVELENLLVDLYGQQGKCERIKNFPYPRQFASINHYFVWLLVLLLPLGMLQEFQKIGEHFVWFTIPFAVLVGWVFVSMDRVGISSENPFEGGSNDIPMAALSRTIEIDLREMLGETELPEPLKPVGKILL